MDLMRVAALPCVRPNLLAYLSFSVMHRTGMSMDLRFQTNGKATSIALPMESRKS